MINNIDARHAACLVYALKARNDRDMQADISYVASELELDDELDVYAALDDLVGHIGELEAATRRPFHCEATAFESASHAMMQLMHDMSVAR